MLTNISRTIDPEFLDSDGFATVPSIYNMIINSIGINIRQSGYGIDVMAGRGYTWALARCGMEFLERPTLYRDISVDVWGSPSQGLCHNRSFSITDSDGRDICRGVTEWCILDKSSRRPVVMDMNGDDNDREQPCSLPRRIRGFLLENVVERITGYSECDFNGHLNNSKYVEMFFDLLPRQIASSLRPLRLDVNFRREVPCGAMTRQGIRMEEDGRFAFSMYCADQLACCASLAMI